MTFQRHVSLMLALGAAFVLAGCRQTEDDAAPSTDTAPQSTSVAPSEQGDEPETRTSGQSQSDGTELANTAEPNPGAENAPVKEQIQAAIDRLEQSLEKLKNDVREIESREDQLAYIQQHNPVPAFVDEMIALAKSNPESPQAVDAALAAVARGKGKDKHRAMHFLLDHFMADLNLTKMIDSFLKEIPGPQYDEYFQKIIRNSKDDGTTAYALLNYSTYIDQIPAFRNALNANPQLLEKLPQAQIDYIQTMPDDDQTGRREECLQRLFDEFADLRYRGQQTYGQLAQRELYELRHLSVGMVAPDIVGRDLDGVEFRLSDYRGKVVMLDFWGHWCFPCRQMYPEERELVRKLGKAPFALIGVNTDSKIETAQSAVANDNLTWRNFWDGPEGTNGPISRQWNITAWPTVYLIDANGVIRYKDILGDDIHTALESLLAEMGQPVALD